VYPIRLKPEDVINSISAMSFEEANSKTNDFIYPHPNTYTFTKAIGESLVNSHKDILPICIVRPSIVTAALREPTPGWVDVMLGPAGLFVAVGMGVLRVMHGSNEILADFIPVDLVCNTIVAAAWHTSLPKDSTDLSVFHCTTGTRNPCLWHVPRQMIPAFFRLNRPKRNIGYPLAFFIQNDLLFNIASFVLHVLPAMVIDLARLVSGKKAFMVKASMRLHTAINSLAHFTSHNWFFVSQKVENLMNRMNEQDLEIFKIDANVIQWEHYLIIMCDGIKKFLIKDPQEQSTIEKKKSTSGSILKYLMSIISLAIVFYFSRHIFYNQWKRFQKWMFQQILKLPPPVLRLMQNAWN